MKPFATVRGRPARAAWAKASCRTTLMSSSTVAGARSCACSCLKSEALKLAWRSTHQAHAGWSDASAATAAPSAPKRPLPASMNSRWAALTCSRSASVGSCRTPRCMQRMDACRACARASLVLQRSTSARSHWACTSSSSAPCRAEAMRESAESRTPPAAFGAISRMPSMYILQVLANQSACSLASPWNLVKNMKSTDSKVRATPELRSTSAKRGTGSTRSMPGQSSASAASPCMTQSRCICIKDASASSRDEFMRDSGSVPSSPCPGAGAAPRVSSRAFRMRSSAASARALAKPVLSRAACDVRPRKSAVRSAQWRATAARSLSGSASRPSATAEGGRRCSSAAASAASGPTHRSTSRRRVEASSPQTTWRSTALALRPASTRWTTGL
mmetsp:Transcript_16004/g.50138  ORF Transcript_16004/g.50138 Transcript_16004/m.50138 type:complete len:389 (+) Transcript_16004:799-1965(+)